MTQEKKSPDERALRSMWEEIVKTLEEKDSFPAGSFIEAFDSSVGWLKRHDLTGDMLPKETLPLLLDMWTFAKWNTPPHEGFQECKRAQKMTEDAVRSMRAKEPAKLIFTESARAILSEDEFESWKDDVSGEALMIVLEEMFRDD